MDYINEIAEEVKTVLEKIDRQEVEQAVQQVTKEKRLFIDGEGRSGFVGKCFAMRMMHLGFTVFVMGESTTPSFAEGDVYLSISGSGNSGSVVLNAEKAKKANATLITIISKEPSTLVTLSDYKINVPATTRGEVSEDKRASIQLLGSLFDQSVHLLTDAMCLMISKRDEISNEEATTKHV